MANGEDQPLLGQHVAVLPDTTHKCHSYNLLAPATGHVFLSAVSPLDVASASLAALSLEGNPVAANAGITVNQNVLTPAELGPNIKLQSTGLTVAYQIPGVGPTMKLEPVAPKITLSAFGLAATGSEFYLSGASIALSLGAGPAVSIEFGATTIVLKAGTAELNLAAASLEVKGAGGITVGQTASVP